MNIFIYEKQIIQKDINKYVCMYIYINIFIYEKWNLYITSISISSPDLHGFVTAHSAVRGSAGSAVRSVTTVQALQVLGPNHGWGPWFESLFFFKKTPETNKNPALFCGFWKPLWLRTCSIYENWDATSPGEPMGQVKHRILPETDVLPCFRSSWYIDIFRTYWMSGWWFGTRILWLSTQLGIIIPTDFHIFQRGRYTTNQVYMYIYIYTRIYIYIYNYIYIQYTHIYHPGNLIIARENDICRK